MKETITRTAQFGTIAEALDWADDVLLAFERDGVECTAYGVYRAPSYPQDGPVLMFHYEASVDGEKVSQ